MARTLRASKLKYGGGLRIQPAAQPSLWEDIKMVDEENDVREPEGKKRKPGGRDNARKHGGFMANLILANENGEEFQQLHESLIEEWNPDPGTEELAVLYLAQSIWVQRRVDRYHRREIALAGSNRKRSRSNDKASARA